MRVENEVNIADLSQRVGKLNRSGLLPAEVGLSEMLDSTAFKNYLERQELSAEEEKFIHDLILNLPFPSLGAMRAALVKTPSTIFNEEDKEGVNKLKLLSAIFIT